MTCSSMQVLGSWSGQVLFVASKWALAQNLCVWEVLEVFTASHGRLLLVRG